MAWLKRHLTEIFCVLFLTVIVGIVAVKNYTSNTFLTGIDNFHIEFDLGLALSRAWSGVWQEDQGVGIVSGLAQMTEIPRVVIYQVLSWALPMNLVRYAYVFGNLYLGMMGVFFLTWYLSKSRLAGLAGALFYVFNLGTLQVFFMPTEMFGTNYAALPWLFLLVFIYLSEGKLVTLWWYAGLLLLFAPMAMTPTIFVVYVLFLGIIILGYLLSRKRSETKWKRISGIVGVTTGMSMYFLLPFANFALNNVSVLTESKINSVFSQENYLTNGGRTSWSDLATLKGMWFDYPDTVDGKLVPLLGIWDSYLVYVGRWVYIPMVMVGIGIATMLWRRKWQGIMVIAVGLVSLILLRGENPPLGGLVVWLRSLPLVAEAFRTPYTKIAPILTLVYAVCFGYGIDGLGQIWRFKIGKTLWKGLMIVGAVAGLVWLNLPYFQGKLISEGVRVKVPNKYFEMFDFFKKEDKSGRVVRLPAYSSQAWDYTDWEYRGSGFLWYGIEQSILDRAFDVWSPYNETFYNQFSTALYGGNSDEVGRVLTQYDVRYVLLDESVIAAGQDKAILRIEETKKLAGELKWEEKFHEGFLTVWDTGNSTNQFIDAPSSYTLVEGDTEKVRIDVVWDEVGTYVEYPTRSDLRSQGESVYPFAGLMREEVKGVEYGDRFTTLRSDFVGVNPTRPALPRGRSDLLIPGWKVGEIVRIEYKDEEPIPVYYVNGQNGPRFLGKEKPEQGKNIIYARVGEGMEWNEYLKEQRFGLQGVALKVEVPGEPQIYDFETEGQGTVGNCDVLKRGTATKSHPSRSDLVGFEYDLQRTRSDLQYIADERGAVCDYVVMSQLDTRLSYLMRVQGENTEGRSLKFFLYNTGSKRNDIEWLMSKDKFDQTFGLLPWAWDGTYTLNIETRSFGQRAENVVDQVEVRWFPLEQIAGARIQPSRSDLVGFGKDLQPTRSDLQIASVKKIGTWLYRVRVEGSGVLKLSQGYDEGWIGLDGNTGKILQHVKVDGWANGWIVGKSQIINDKFSNGAAEIYIFYWPQLLEYLGFVLLGITVWIVIKSKSDKN